MIFSPGWFEEKARTSGERLWNCLEWNFWWCFPTKFPSSAENHFSKVKIQQHDLYFYLCTFPFTKFPQDKRHFWEFRVLKKDFLFNQRLWGIQGFRGASLVAFQTFWVSLFWSSRFFSNITHWLKIMKIKPKIELQVVIHKWGDCQGKLVFFFSEFPQWSRVFSKKRGNHQFTFWKKRK